MILSSVGTVNLDTVWNNNLAKAVLINGTMINDYPGGCTTDQGNGL